ncbi:MAG: hypothetical protein KAG56_02140 [Sulfurovaceae bacterium]|nr:hypothetical protein [Sulfurovaceae bacterium]
MLETIIIEIIVCLIIAWILGFFAAWLIKRGPNKDLEEEIFELQEDLKFKSAYCRGLEKENAHQDILLKEYREDYTQAVLQKNTDT